MELWQWHYKRVLAFFIDAKPTREGEASWLPADRIGESSLTVLRGKFPDSKKGKLPLSPHRAWADVVGWFAWDDDFEYADSLDGVLSSLGEHGWELVGIQAATQVTDLSSTDWWGASYYIFKRPFDYQLDALIEERLEDTDSRRTFTQEEVEEQIKQWRKESGMSAPEPIWSRFTLS